MSICVTDGMTVTSLSASLWHKKRAAMHRVGQITLNQKLYDVLPMPNHIKAKVIAHSQKVV